MLTSGSEMIIGQEFVHIPARDGGDRSGLGGRNQGQRHVDTALHERLAAGHMLLYDPPNQIARCAALSFGKHLELLEDLLRELDCSLHENHCPTSGSPGNSRHRARGAHERRGGGQIRTYALIRGDVPGSSAGWRRYAHVDCGIGLYTSRAEPVRAAVTVSESLIRQLPERPTDIGRCQL